jgi:hypothetical protein
MHAAKKQVFLRSVRRLLVTANVVPSSPILVTLMLEALSSSKRSVLTRVTQRNNQEHAILHSHRHENLKSYISNEISTTYIHNKLFLRSTARPMRKAYNLTTIYMLIF